MESCFLPLNSFDVGSFIIFSYCLIGFEAVVCCFLYAIVAVLQIRFVGPYFGSFEFVTADISCPRSISLHISLGHFSILLLFEVVPQDDARSVSVSGAADCDHFHAIIIFVISPSNGSEDVAGFAGACLVVATVRVWIWTDP